MRAEDQHAVEKFAAEIDRHDFADQLAGAVGITGVQDIRHHQRGVLSRGDMRRRLIDLGRGSENEIADGVLAAGVDHIDHAAHADVEHQFGRAVEKFSAVDEGQVMHLVHALGGAVNRSGVADIASDEFDILLDIGEPARAAARIVVEYADFLAGLHQSLDQARADEA